MARRKQQTGFIRGTATHKRTESDYMGVLLDTVTLDDWRDVVAQALAAAKSGDPSARAWLAQYIVGKPAHKAPAPLTVVVQQLNGADAVVDRLARPAIDRAKYPFRHEDDDREEQIRNAIAVELAKKLPAPKSVEAPALVRVPRESAHSET